MKRAGFAVLLAVAVSAIVAVAATGTGLLGPGVMRGDGWMRVLRFAGGSALVVGLTWLLIQRRRSRAPAERSRDPTASALATAATMMGVLALLSLLAPAVPAPPQDEPAATAGERIAPEPGGEDTGGGRPPPPLDIPGMGLGAGRASPPAGYAPETLDPVTSANGRLDPGVLRHGGRALLLLLLLAIVFVILRALARRRGALAEEAAQEPALEGSEAEAVLEASLIDVADPGGDPRLQITAAYHRLLNALTKAGAARAPYEAPHEHLYRTLGPLGVRPESMHRLTELYVIAQFGRRAVTDRQRDEAAAALHEGLDSLRGARRAAEVT